MNEKRVRDFMKVICANGGMLTIYIYIYTQLRVVASSKAAILK